LTRASNTDWAAATTGQLLSRYGVVTRETVASEALAGGFAPVYGVLKAMEDAGRVRRGYFVAGLGAAQFAMPAALDLLRSMRDPPENPRTVIVAATDPANPYGTILEWPDLSVHSGAEDNPASPKPQENADEISPKPQAKAERGPTRTVGALVVLVDGFSAAYLKRGERELLLFLPDSEPGCSRTCREVARALLGLATGRPEGHRGMLIAEINGEASTTHSAARIFVDEGFAATAMGLQVRLPLLRPNTGIHIAAAGAGGLPMAQQLRRDEASTVDDLTMPANGETRETEQERIRSSNDWDQAMEHAGRQSRHNRGYDEAVHGAGTENIDPDSAESDIERDDTSEE
jgi:ATP-dependent Lhr-like helicase